MLRDIWTCPLFPVGEAVGTVGQRVARQPHHAVVAVLVTGEVRPALVVRQAGERAHAVISVRARRHEVRPGRVGVPAG